MTNDCKTCPVSTGTHKPAEAMHQIAEPSSQTPEDAQIQALMRKHRIWIEHSTLFENDEPERELRAVQAEEHQFNAFVQDLIAATQLAAAPQAVQPAVHVAHRHKFTDGHRTLKQDVFSAIHDYSATKPEQDHDDSESWESWFEAAFDLLGTRVGQIFEEHAARTAADPAHPAEGVPATVRMLDDRAAFEASVQKEHYWEGIRENLFDRLPSGKYAVVGIERHWQTWMAALAATHPTQQGLDAQDASVLQYLLSNAKYHEWDGGYRADFDISINADVNGVRAESAKEAVQNILAAQAKQGGA